MRSCRSWAWLLVGLCACGGDTDSGSDPSPELPPVDVENSYTPPSGKQVRSIRFECAAYVRSVSFEYDAAGRIKQTRMTQTTSDDGKTIETVRTFAYLDDHILIDGACRFCLDDAGRTTRIESYGKGPWTLGYDGDLLRSAESADENISYTYTWSGGNCIETGDGMGNRRTFTDKPNRTNLDLCALLTDACITLEAWAVPSSGYPACGTFAFYGARSACLPATTSYARNPLTTFSYELDDDGCPAKIVSERSDRYGGTYTIEYN